MNVRQGSSRRPATSRDIGCSGPRTFESCGAGTVTTTRSKISIPPARVTVQPAFVSRNAMTSEPWRISRPRPRDVAIPAMPGVPTTCGRNRRGARPMPEQPDFIRRQLAFAAHLRDPTRDDLRRGRPGHRRAARDPALGRAGGGLPGPTRRTQGQGGHLEDPPAPLRDPYPLPHPGGTDRGRSRHLRHGVGPVPCRHARWSRGTADRLGSLRLGASARAAGSVRGDGYPSTGSRG